MKRVVATGNFDGLHLGHQRLFEVMRAEAGDSLEMLGVTYAPHTRHFLDAPGKPPLITPSLERARLFAEAGIPLQLVTFDRELASLTGLEFVRQVIIGKFQASTWLFGPFHRFGSGGQGSVDEVRAAFPGLKVVQVPPVELEGGTISSSRIREALLSGKLELANEMLGRSYSLVGTVVSGDARGREIGFPTANIETEPFKLLPQFGVYAGVAHFDAERHMAVVNVGNRPTFNGVKPSVEVHLPGWSGDLYGKKLDMKLDLLLRGERRFGNVSELTAQIACDVQRAKSTVNL